MAECLEKDENVLANVDFDCYQRKTYNSIRDNINWIYGTSDKQMGRLKNYLLNLDKSERVDLGSERSKNVLNGVSEILDRISKGIEELDPRFKGTLVSTGSSNNQTKIGDSDEFDFIYELDVNDLLKGRGTVTRYDSDYGVVVVKINDGPNSEIVKLINMYPLDSDSETPIKETVLDMMNIETVFRDLVVHVLFRLKLPEGWRHGGFNSPSCSGLHRQGPSYVLQFDFLNTRDGVPLCMSVDFVPMIRIRKPTDVDISKLNQFLMTETGMEYCWVSLDDTGASLLYGHAEELLLKKYPASSVPKRVIRICKALRTFLRINSPKYPTKEYVTQVVDARKKTMLGETVAYPIETPNYQISRVDGLIDIPGVENYITYSDLGETIGNECMVKSYYIKQIVLLMLSVDQSKGRKWTDEDLPDLVITVFRLMTDFIRPYKHPFPTLTLVEIKFSVPIEDNLVLTNPQTNEQLPNDQSKYQQVSVATKSAKKTVTSPDTEKGSPVHECKMSIIYAATKLAMKEGNREFKIPVRFIESRLSSIFQLFRSVCEGQMTAEIIFYKHIGPSRADWSLLVTHKRYEEMIAELKRMNIC